MNRRGQILILFIIFIPIFIALAAFAIDMGHSFYRSNKLNNLSRMVLKYGLEHIEEEDVRDKMIDLIYKNDKDIDSYKLIIEDNKIILNISKTIDSVFGKAIDFNFYYLSANYIGYIENDKIIIEKG
ncbi:MAG TPA: hypothetical protein GXZ95_04235 [Mollicutes bacterium]|nr:hypothetical protein [Mollicutes bacterium]